MIVLKSPNEIAIIEQNGSLHCLTMQLPAALELRSSQEFIAA